MSDYTVVPAQEMNRIISTGAIILDVRRPEEHDEQHLTAAHDLVTLDQLKPADFMLRRGLDKDAPVYMLCRSGMRARKAAEMFGTEGYKNIYVIDGGILACAAAGVPVSGATAAPAQAQPAKTISLERQVRIIAGVVITLGTLLGHSVHPAFYLLPFGGGLGLFFSGVTDRCGLALLLLKAPWNKSAPAAYSLPKTPAAPTTGGCA